MKQNSKELIKHIVFDALMLGLMIACSFCIQTENLKISLQLLFIFLFGLLSTSLFDNIIVTVLYLLMGLFLPIYAGFSSGISATFGFVIGFIPGIIMMYFIKKWCAKISAKKKIYKILIYILSCFICLLIVYAFGVGFMFSYFKTVGKTYSFLECLYLCVIPYIPFDLAKMAVAILGCLPLEKPYQMFIANK